MNDKRIEDYAHLNIDHMSGRQLAEFSQAVTNSAIDILTILGSHSMPYHDLVKMLETSGMDASEVAFGLMWGVYNFQLDQMHINNVRTIKLREIENEPQPEG